MPVTGPHVGQAPLTAAWTITSTWATTVTIDWGDSTATTGPLGTHTHTWTTPGVYTATITLTDGADAETETITVTATLPASTHNGPCSPWVTPTDVPCVDGAITVDTAAETATQWLYHATCLRYPGTCTTEIRPWTDGCTPTGPLDLTRWVTGPIRAVTAVTVNGDTIDPDLYRVDNLRWFTPTRRDATETHPLIPWPPQLRSRHAGDTGTWSITVEHGADPPAPLIAATVRLACEIIKQADGSEDCALPDGVTSISRDGVTLQFAERRDGRTGVPFVDTVLDMFGCRRHPSRIHDPLAPRAATGRYP